MSVFPGKGARNNKVVRKRSPQPVADQEPVKGGAAKQAASTLSLSYLFGLHRHVASEAFKRLWQTPVASLMNCLMIALAFVLPALFYLLVANIQQLGENWDGNPKISLYLTSGISNARLDKLKAEMASVSSIDSVTYISPEEGLTLFQKQAGIRGVVSELGFNPLPGVLQLETASDLSSEQLDQLVDRFKKLSGVEQVKLDKQWVQRLLAIAELLEQAASVLAILLGLTIWLAISNTIGLSIEARKDEIRVVKLVGGTDGFIMLPFLYTGVIYGVIGACFAILIVWMVLVAMMPPVMGLMGLYGGSFDVVGPGVSMFFTLMLSGLLLGILGALMSCYRHLRNYAPC